MLVGHADAAVHLHALLHRQRRHSGRFGLGDGDEQLGLVVAGIEQLGGLQRRGAGNLDLSIEMCGAVLQRLELSDQLPELLALLQIFEGHLAGAGGNSDQFGSGSRPARVQRPQRAPAAVDLADDRIGIDRDIVEFEPRRLAAVGQRGGVDIKASRTLLYREQREAVRLAGRAARARRHQDDIGAIAMDDELLGTIEDEPIALPPGLQRDPGRVAMPGLVDGQRRHRPRGFRGTSARPALNPPAARRRRRW